MNRVIGFTRFLIVLILMKLSQPSEAVESRGQIDQMGLRHLLGQGVDEYFRGFDIILSGLQDWSKSAIEEDKIHKYSRIPNIALVGSINMSTSSGVGNILWDNIRRSSENNASLAVLINLKELASLPNIQKQIRLIHEHKTIHQHKEPYFFVIHSQILSQSQISKIQNQTEDAKGFDIDTDVYFSYLICSEVKNKPVVFQKILLKVEKSLCRSGSAEVKMLEFYSIKDDSFIVPVNFVDMQLAQKVIRRTNFRKSPLISVAAYGYPLRAQFTKENDSFVGGYEAEQIRFLAESYNLSVMAGIGHGWINLENQTLTGMGAQVINNEADISISASEVLPYRASYLTFLHPTYYTKMWGFFVQPPSSSFRDIFIHAFTGDLWLTMFSTWILIVFAMSALAVVKRRLDTMHENDTVLIQELIIWAAGAICQQGWHICPESTCMKIIFIFALITGLVSYVAYSAALVSILSMKVVPIRHLNDLVNHRYTIYQDNHTLNAKYVIEELEAAGLIPCLPIELRSIEPEPALSKILSSNSALLGVSDLFYPTVRKNMNDTNICNFLSKISVSARPIRGGMFLKKGSPLRDFLNHKVLLMYERGIRYRLLETYFKVSSVMCLEKSGSTKDPLGFNDVYTAFVVLLLGYCISFVILIIERVFPPPDYGGESFFAKAKAILQISVFCKTVKVVSKPEPERKIPYDPFGDGDKWQ